MEGQNVRLKKLKGLKDSNPVELAEYAVANLILDEPAFKWWVPPTLKKRNRAIAKVKSKYWRTSHKFGIRVPKSIDEGLGRVGSLRQRFNT